MIKVEIETGRLSGSIIPFFGVIKGMLLGSVLDELTRYLDTWFLGFSSYSDLLMMIQSFFIRVLGEMVQHYFKTTDIPEFDEDHPSLEIIPVISGHSSGGLFAKSYAAANGIHSMAFESPQLEDSRVYEIMNRDRNNKLGWERMINIYSGGSLISMAEPNATSNFVLPRIQSILKPAGTYETFCLIAAGCTQDDHFDHFDHFCSHAVGKSTYEGYYRGT